MKLNHTRKRRLVVLMMVIVMGAGGFVGVRKYFARRLHLRCVAWRAEGLGAEARGDHAKAIDELRQYRHYHPDDRVALAAFIEARPHVASPNHQETTETISALRYLLGLEPKEIQAQRQLTNLYLQIGQDTEAREGAERLLELQNGNDPAALRILAIANARMKDWGKSLEALDRLLKLMPTDLPGQMQRLATMREMGKPRADIVKLAEQLRRAPENRLPDGADDPRFMILKSVALELAEFPTDPNPPGPGERRDDKTAADWLRIAAVQNPPDAQFSTILVERMTRMGMHDEAMIVLRRMADVGDRPDAESLLVRRLWELRQWPELIVRSEKLIGANAQPDAELLAVRAIALQSAGKGVEAKSIVAKLAERSGDLVAAAWLRVVQQEIDPASVDPKALRAALQQVANRDAYLEYFLGDAYLRIGESELAVKSWEKAASEAPSWGLPLERLSNVLLDRGRPDVALAAARASVVRARDAKGTVSGSTAMTLIRAEAANLESGTLTPGEEDVAERKLLERVDEIQKASPGESFTLPIQVALLAKIGQTDRSAAGGAAKERAVAVMKAALADDRQPTEDTLLRLAVVSRGYKLGFEEPCLNRCEKLHGLGPNLAMARAGSLFAEGKQGEGIRYIRAARAKQPAGKDPARDVAWDLVIARALEMAHDPEASSKWRAVAEAYPDSPGVQEVVLNASSVQAQRNLIDQTIERLKKLTGGDGLTWRVARARWLLDPAAPPRADVESAAALLNEVLKSSPGYGDAHFLLARCLELLGDSDGAIEHMKMAASCNPGSNAAALNLVRLVQAHGGNFQKTGDLLEELARRRFADAGQRRQAAILFAQAGKTQQALEILGEPEHPDEVEPDLLRASLYDQQDRFDEAMAICQKLLRQPDVAVIQFAATLYSSHGDSEAATQTLKLLDGLKLPAGLRESILAQHAARFSKPEEAQQWYEAAVKAGPANVVAWQDLIGWHLRAGRAREALAAADEGLRNLPDEKSLLGVKQNAAVLTRASEVPELRLLSAAIVESPSQRSVVGEALALLLSARGGEPERALKSIRAVVDKYPTLLAMQLYYTDAAVREGNVEDAAAVAERIAYNFPARAEGPRLAAGLLMNAGQWGEAIQMAKLWRERSLRDAILADLAIARAHLELHQAAEAVKQIEPDALAAATHPNSNAHTDALALYCCGLSLLKDSAKAYALLDPVLANDPQGRYRWMMLAVRYLDEDGAKAALDRVSALTDANAESEQLRLAEMWMTLSQRTGGKYLSAARQHLEPLLKQHAPSAAALTAMGSVEEQQGHADRAEPLYRRALERDRAFFAANNNLAMLLLQKEGSAEATAEAVTLAHAAVKAMPAAATYDTLARVQARAGDAAAAISSMKMSVKLDPIAHRRLNLIGMLLDLNRRDEARSAIAALEAATGPGLNDEARRRLQELRQRLLGSGSAATAPSAAR